MRDLKNPGNFFARFLMHFALGYSALLVAGGIVWLIKGDLDLLFFFVASLAFGVVFGVIRAAVAKPGSPFWWSPAVD
ncbi:MAG: hypothetical protein Q4F67_09915 [Propionibacteriaceae bacterium]|nr:hypothetical protein [Propionibacteriaceae bacterium]